MIRPTARRMFSYRSRVFSKLSSLCARLLFARGSSPSRLSRPLNCHSPRRSGRVALPQERERERDCERPHKPPLIFIIRQDVAAVCATGSRLITFQSRVALRGPLIKDGELASSRRMLFPVYDDDDYEDDALSRDPDLDDTPRRHFHSPDLRLPSRAETGSSA